MDNTIYCIWSPGSPEMPQNRRFLLEDFKKKSECNVILIDEKNLNEYIIKEHPLHDAFNYLTPVHKSDYLRCYIMNFHGGGYSDVKSTKSSWINAFNKLNEDDNKWLCGYPELNAGFAIPYVPARSRWYDLIGNGCFICKKQTPYTIAIYNNIIDILDKKLDKLKKFGWKNNDNQDIWMGNKNYPLEYTEILGQITHKHQLEYSNHILNILPWFECHGIDYRK